MNEILIVLSAILCDNLLLSRLFGVESFFTATEKPLGAGLYGGLVTCVTVISGTISYALYSFVLKPLNITFFLTFAGVIIITGVICAFQFLSTKLLPKISDSVEANIPLVAGNCIVLGSVFLCAQHELSFGMGVLYLLATGVGFTLAMFVFTSVQKMLSESNVAYCFRGIPILLLSAMLAAMAFYGFYGLGA